MKLIHIDKVYMHVVGTVSDFRARRELAAQPRTQSCSVTQEEPVAHRAVSMRDLVVSKALRAPSIRAVFAPALAA